MAIIKLRDCHRTTDREPVPVVLNVRFWKVTHSTVKVIRIERSVLKKFVGLAVELIGAATGHHIKNAAGGMPLRGIINIGLHDHFLDRLAREGDSYLGERTGVGSPSPRPSRNNVRNAIHGEIVSCLPHPIDAEQ